MNEQEQRIAIARLCNISDEQIQRWIAYEEAERQFQCAEIEAEEYYRRHLRVDPPPTLPDYLHDLNALQPVVIDLICGDLEKEKAFLKAFNDCIDGYADSEDVPVICEWDAAMLCAPAWVWAKAVLVALGKWKE